MQEAGLGKLVHLDKRRRPARPRPDPATGGQVVMFTGVRYERGPGSEPDDGTSPVRPKRKRG